MSFIERAEGVTIAETTAPKGSWHWRNLGRPNSSDGRLSAGVGAVATGQGNGTPSTYVFAQSTFNTTDHTLMVNEGPGYFINADGPVEAPIGATTDGVNGACAFVLDGQGALLGCEGADKRWVWHFYGTPGPGIRCLSGIGATTLTPTSGSRPRPTAVTYCNDRNIWAYLTGPKSAKWFNLGKPTDAAIVIPFGVLAVDAAAHTQVLHLYVLGGDGALWRGVSDLRTTVWESLGHPPYPAVITGGAGVVTVQDGPGQPTRPYVFVTSVADSALWVNWFDGFKTDWDGLGGPPNGLNTGLGALAFRPNPGYGQCPVVLVRNTDSAIWAKRWDGTKWNWEDTGTKATIVATIGAAVTTNVDGTQQPHFYLLGDEGYLWDVWYA